MLRAADLVEQVSLTPYQAIGIPIALVGAVFLSLGAQLQHTGVTAVEASHGSGERAGLSFRELRALLGRPSWVIGTLLLGTAIVLQLVSLRFAPLIVVQPLGAVGLVLAVVLNARQSKLKLSHHVHRSIVLCIGGVGVFVAFAAVFAVETPIDTDQLVTILVILAVVVAAAALAFAIFRKRAGAIFYIVMAGVLYGLVATLAKVVLNRLAAGEFDLLTAVCVVGLVGAMSLGAYFVQTAYSVGSPDLVIAGLTVVDPLVAVGIGIVVLGETAQAPVWTIPVFLAAGAVAVAGVFQLAKHHPQTHR